MAEVTLNTTVFLHGLDSSSQGTKGRYLASKFPDVVQPDFNGGLEQRLDQLEDICRDLETATLIGSSFGGLMATCYAIRHPLRVNKLILLAPALNFEDYQPPPVKITVPTLLVIGRKDTVCPPALVTPLAEATFSKLQITISEDDHLLREIFLEMEWQKILAK